MVKLSASVHPSLTETVTEKLRRKNVVTIVDFVAANSDNLATSSGLSHEEILQVKQHIMGEVERIKKNALELLEAEKKDVMSTGVACLDELLKGGLNPGYLYELCGVAFTGKTQLCLTVAANVTASQSDVIVWYFDTKRDFSRMRFEEILKAKNLEQKDIEETLTRTKVCKVCSFQEFIDKLQQLLLFYGTEEAQKNIRLIVIIDSIVGIIFDTSRGTNSQTVCQLDNVVEVCQFLATRRHATIITVNRILDSHREEEMEPMDVTPAATRYWHPIPATRLLLKRQEDEIRKIYVLRNPQVKLNDSCTVTISNAGVTDV